MIVKERGKPVSLPFWAGKPQGALLVVRVWDGGESEGLAVIAGIRVGTSSGAKASPLPSGLSLHEG